MLLLEIKGLAVVIQIKVFVNANVVSKICKVQKNVIHLEVPMDYILCLDSSHTLHDPTENEAYLLLT